MKKALFAYQYGMENAGDFAINIGSLDLLCEFYDQITVISKLTVSDKRFEINKSYLLQYYNNIEVIEGPFKLNRSSAINTVKNYVVGLLKYPYFLFKGKYNKSIKCSEMAFLNGGNLLRCNSFTDYVRLYALIFPLRLALRNNIDFILLPQSTTSINKSGRKLLAPYLEAAKIVFAREELSKKVLENCFPKSNIVSSFDTAFFIKDREVIENAFFAKYGYLAKENNNICITLRKENIGDIGELNIETIFKIRHSIEGLVEKLLQNEYSVTFVIQTIKDRNFTRSIYEKFVCYKQVLIVEEYDPLLLREIYRNSICLFGMRLHSIILAMSVNTPVVGYFDKNWGNKNPGTLDKFCMPYGYIDENPDLYSLFANAKALKNRMIMEIEKSKENFKNILNKEEINKSSKGGGAK